MPNSFTACTAVQTISIGENTVDVVVRLIAAEY